MSEIRLTEDGELVLQVAHRLCAGTNVAIVAPEHLLGAALLVLKRASEQLPDDDTVTGAVIAVQGQGSEPLAESVMFGSAAREVVNGAAAAVRAGSGEWIDARMLAAACIESGEVNPMFYGAVGLSRERILDVLREIR